MTCQHPEFRDDCEVCEAYPCAEFPKPARQIDCTQCPLKRLVSEFVREVQGLGPMT